MRTFPTSDAVQQHAYELTMRGQACHLETRDGSPVVVQRDRVIARVGK